jgi:chaperonin GroES
MSEGREKAIPLRDRIVVLPDEAEGVSRGGIHIPETAQAPPCRGVVVAVGEGAWIGNRLNDSPVKVGDRVLFSRFAGVTVKLNPFIEKTEHTILRFDDILAILEQEDIQ